MPTGSPGTWTRTRFAPRPLLPPGPQTDLRARRREQASWYFYDWANSGWVVLVGSVLLGPLLTGMAERSACGHAGTPDNPCRGFVSLGPMNLAAGSVASYTVVLATLASAAVVPLVGVLVDRVVSKRRVLLACAWAAALAGCAVAVMAPDAWLPAALLTAVTAVLLASSLVASDSIMVAISEPSERDRVSTLGWAWGYLGGLVVLLLSLAWLVRVPGGSPSQAAVSQVVVLGAIWWAAWTLVPYFGVRDRVLEPAVGALATGPRAPLRQLRETFADLLGHRQAARMLLAFLVYNDGMQSLFAANSVYATRELGFGAEQMVITLIVAQPVAFVGALASGRLAHRFGARATIMGSLVIWAAAPVVAALLPRGQFAVFLVFTAVVGLVIGGTQSLSRALYSRLIPSAKAAEFFGLYQAADRGTSWFGSLTFALVFQLTGSYRLAVAVLLVFFVVGALLLSRVRVAEGAAEAGNS